MGRHHKERIHERTRQYRYHTQSTSWYHTHNFNFTVPHTVQQLTLLPPTALVCPTGYRPGVPYRLPPWCALPPTALVCPTYSAVACAERPCSSSRSAAAKRSMRQVGSAVMERARTAEACGKPPPPLSACHRTYSCQTCGVVAGG